VRFSGRGSPSPPLAPLALFGGLTALNFALAGGFHKRSPAFPPLQDGIYSISQAGLMVAAKVRRSVFAGRLARWYFFSPDILCSPMSQASSPGRCC
jgi:hypothetical protein